MGDKYIIELEDKPFHKEDGDFLYRVKGFNSLVFDMTGISKLTPYTEPDLEQVKKEAYEKGWKDLRKACVPEDDEAYDIGWNEGYENGLTDAWEAARKLYEIDFDVLCELFGKVSVRSEVLDMFTASEVLQKLRTYEQEKEEKKKTNYYFEMVKDAIETTAEECGMSLDEVAAILEKMRKE